jgi:molecular chaperone Hsp33
MNDEAEVSGEETGYDRVLGFTVPGRNARGRIVRLGPVLETVLSAHDYPAPVRHLLAEALVLTAMMGSLLKDEMGQLTVQAQAEGGAVDLLVCDYRSGELRGYVRHDMNKLVDIGASPKLEALFGSGFLCITFDLATTGERYQGIVPLEGPSLAVACENYFRQSEQIPTLLQLAVRSEGAQCVAAGLLLQHFPEGEEGGERLHLVDYDPDWQHVSTLAGSIRHEELIDDQLSLEALVWRLFHEEPVVRVAPLAALIRGCRCSVEYYRGVLGKFPEDQLLEMKDPDGTIPVDCAFCSKTLKVDL